MTTLPSSQFEFGDEVAPNFDVFIEGKDVSEASTTFQAIRPLVASVSYEEDEEMAALFELTVINQPDLKIGTGAPIDWKAVLDCKAFMEGNSIDLFMGYAGVKQYMGRVEIVKWLPKGTVQGVGTFVIKGYDGRHKMMLGNQYKAKKPKEERVAKGKSSKKSRGRRKSGGKKGQAQKQRHVFRSMTDDQIVAKIAAKYGYATDCDTPEKGLQSKVSGGSKATISGGGKNIAGGTKARRTSSLPSRVQPSDQTDWQFLQRLAQINRFDLWVDFDLDSKQWTVHFKKRKDAGNAVHTFTYNGKDGSLLEWEAEFAITEQTTSIEVLHYDRKAQKVELTTISEETKEEDVSFGTAKPGDFTAKKTVGAGARVRFTAFGQTLEAIANKPFRSRTDAEKFAQDWLKERERDFLILKGKVVGLETLRPRQIHEFVGMSTRCDGVYRLTQVKHLQQAGQPYVVEFIAHKVLSQEITRRKPTTKATVAKGKQVISGGGTKVG